MVTQQELDDAEAVLAAAEVELDLATAFHVNVGTQRAVVVLQSAEQAAGAARVRARHLRVQLSGQEAAGRARERAEAAFEGEAEEMAVRLAAGRDAAVTAIVAVEKAAVELLERVAAYSALVRESAADLRGRGLDAGDGRGSGGTAGGTVHLAGEVYQPADAGSLLAAVASSAVRAREAQHPFAASHPERLGGLATRVAADELLSRAAGR